LGAKEKKASGAKEMNDLGAKETKDLGAKDRKELEDGFVKKDCCLFSIFVRARCLSAPARASVKQDCPFPFAHLDHAIRAYSAVTSSCASLRPGGGVPSSQSSNLESLTGRAL